MNRIILEAALRYAEQGFSVIPLNGKQPAMMPNGKPFAWSGSQVKPAPMSYIHEWHLRGYLQNVGIVCGKVSGNLAVIDLDGDQPVAHFRDEFPDLVETYTIKTGSLHGAHLYFYCDALPQTTRTKGYELRANGCYVVAPPSIHPVTGAHYSRATGWEIMRVPDLERVKQWILDMIPKRPAGTSQTQEKRTIGAATVPAWARAAVQYELRDLYRATEGSRNNQLNLAAYNLGQIVGDGHLSRHEIERDLLIAAQAIGLDEISAQRTIQSGLEAGISNPRSKQWQRRR